MEYKTINNKVNSFVKEINKLGNVQAKTNFTCCQTCGHYEMKVENIKNYIFYHQQTADSMKASNTCYFAHSFECDNIKKMVLDIAHKYGSSWDGSDNKAIEIKL